MDLMHAANGHGVGEGRLAPCRNIPNLLFPFCVSTVFCKTLSEPEPPWLEGLDSFFFFDKFCV